MDECRGREVDRDRRARRRVRPGLAALALVLLTAASTLAAPVPSAAAAGAPALQVSYNGQPVPGIASKLGAGTEPARTYTVDYPAPRRCVEGETVNGSGVAAWSMAAIVRAATGDPARVTSISITRPASLGGGSIPLSRADVDPATNSGNPGGTDFLQGPAVVYRSGAHYSFFRPLRAACDGTDINANDWIQGEPVVIAITGGHTLAVGAAANASAPQLRQTITLSASVANRAGNETFTYSWNFGDGTRASGLSTNTVAHAYARAGTFHPTVTVSGSVGSAGTSPPLTIVVGRASSPPATAKPRPQPPPAPGGGSIGSVSGQGTGSRPTVVGEATHDNGETAGTPKPTKLATGSASRSPSKGSGSSATPEAATVRGILLSGTAISDGLIGATTFRGAAQPALGGHGTTTASRVRDAVGRVGGVASVLAAVALFAGGGLSELDPKGRRWRRRRRKAVMA